MTQFCDAETMNLCATLLKEKGGGHSHLLHTWTGQSKLFLAASIL